MVTNSIITTCDSGTGNFMSYYLDPDDVSKETAYGITLLNKYATDEFTKFAAQTREYFLNGKAEHRRIPDWNPVIFLRL